MMYNKMRYLLLVLCMAVTHATAQSSSGEKEKQVFDELIQESRRVKALYAGASEEAIIAQEVYNRADELHRRWLNSGGGPVDEAYLQTLHVHIQALKTIKQQDAKSKLLRETIREVRNDLESKIAFSKRGMNAATAFPSRVNVAVFTKKGNQEVPGLLVRANPVRYGYSRSPLYPFNSATSPSKGTLPPGRLLLWVESPDGQRVATQIITIGSTMSNMVDGRERIDVAIPQ